ncbi:MAG: hypothetical protein QGG60_06430 [Anaerolineales bacterium]|nr:hypothetical protein [Anaerolineales bacterium]MDP7345502.1 hypothetical protein [Anaerolineales bacterium]MDP7644324.1 hypothetical protein [Anaerolineales bacterium]
MQLRCPYCSEMGGLNGTHSHMVATHHDLLRTETDSESGKMHYVVPCPLCGLSYRHRVKPRNRNPRFLSEFRKEIALVAFDQMLYHVVHEHPDAVGVKVDELRSE